MPTPDDEPARAVSFGELADLQAGLLSADEEADLRMRMAEDPEVPGKLTDLDEVDRLLAYSPTEDEPADMPADVAARLQACLAADALRRVRGDPPPSDLPPPPPDGVAAQDGAVDHHAPGRRR